MCRTRLAYSLGKEALQVESQGMNSGYTEVPCDYWFAVVKQHSRAGTILKKWQKGPKATYKKARGDDSLGENSARLDKSRTHR